MHAFLAWPRRNAIHDGMTLPLPLSDDALLDWLNREGPMNRAEAVAVMERRGLDGLIIGQPVNVFHASGHWPQIARTRMGQPPGTFVVMTRRGEMALITSRFLHVYTFADGRVPGGMACYLYDDLADTDQPGPGRDGPVLPDRGHVPLSALEAHRFAHGDAARAQRQGFNHAGAALIGALREMGLWGGVIGTDEPVLAGVLARHDHPGTVITDENILREIRLIKSDLEIALMMRASEANVQALNAVGHAARAGASHRDMHALFRAETARRGNTAVFLNVDRASSELAPDRLRDGQALFFDAVSHFQNYHGDFARTVFIGEPTATAARAAEAAAFAWQAVREQLRPGLRYSQIVALGQAALAKAGYDVNIGLGPHSVGLAHTDEPGEDAGGFWRKPDIELRAGMIMSVDCPVLDCGIGGSAHCEDLVLITNDGCETIHSLHEPVIVL